MRILATSAFLALSIYMAPTQAQANVCPTVYQPVCATNWDRYTNACYAAQHWAKPLKGGALIELADSEGGILWFWSTNDEFIDEAIAIEAGYMPMRVPSLNQLKYGSFCSEPHGFYPDPENMAWADLTIELCDGNLSYIDTNLHAWMNEVHQWCPWYSEIRSVWDYR